MKGKVNVPGVNRAELDEFKKEVNEALENAGGSDAYVKKTGGTMEGALVAQNNEDYGTKQVRNAFIIAEGAAMPKGDNGDLCFVYKP